MTAPTPEQMRALADAEANRRDDRQDPYWTSKAIKALRAAADEVGRLRANVARRDVKLDNYAVDLDRLRAVIENAPHREHCRPHIACTCWKADAL